MLFSSLVKRKEREYDHKTLTHKQNKRRKTLERLQKNLQQQQQQTEQLRQEYEDKIAGYESLLQLTKQKHDSEINAKLREISALQQNIAVFEKQKQFAISKLQHFNQLQNELSTQKQHIKVLLAEQQTNKQTNKRRQSLGGAPSSNTGGWFASSSSSSSSSNNNDQLEQQQKDAETAKLVLDLKHQIKELTRYTETLEKSDKRLKQLTTEQSQELSVKHETIKTITDKVNVLQTQNKQDVQSIMTLESDVTGLQTRVQQLQAIISNKQQALTTLQNDKSHRTQTEIQQLEEYVKSLEQQQQQQQQAMNTMQQELNQQIATKNKEVSQLRHQLQVSSDFAELTKTQLEELQKKADEFQEYIAVLETKQKNKQNTCQQLEQTIESLQSQLTAQQQQHTYKANQHTQQVQTLQDKLVKALEEYKTIKANKEKLQQTLQQQQQQIQTFQQQAQMNNTYVDKVKHLQSNIEQLKTELLCATQLAKGSSELCAKLEEEKNQLKEQLIEAENFMETQHGEVASRLEQQLAQTRLKYAQTEQEKDEMQDEIQDLKEELSNLKQILEKDQMARQFRFKAYNNNNNHAGRGNSVPDSSPRSSFSGYSRTSSRRSSFANENDMMEFLGERMGKRSSNLSQHQQPQPQQRPALGAMNANTRNNNNNNNSNMPFMNPVKNQAPPSSFIGRLFGSS